MPAAPLLRHLSLGDAPAEWAALGFEVEGATCRIGSVALELTGAGGGIRAWTIEGDGGSGDIDGLPTTWVRDSPPAPPPVHPNGALGIDHVVVLTDALDRTAAALGAAGAEIRRIGEPQGARQAFLWLGDVILEVVEPAARRRPGARFWGLTVVVGDIERAAGHVGPVLGPARDAVQSGRRIATVRREAGLGIALALMTPHERAPSASPACRTGSRSRA